ncbi:unnamed protein product [Heligmosomoides polygyrus]|uniref:Reverse transcriptase domain-containing protein n=1 Tax=Heligmosomoides polygyrus TaxID=6339 RepID=A0A183GSU8_HELPZ|nr:unnamed protein product [Heligmosomoides polygyrus]
MRWEDGAFTKYGVHYGKVVRFRIFRDTLTACITRGVTESIMAAAPVFRRADVPIKVTCEYDDILRRHLCCLLIKQAPKLILGLIGAASLRSIRREEMIVTKSFGDDYTDTTGGPGTSA